MLFKRLLLLDNIQTILCHVVRIFKTKNEGKNVNKCCIWKKNIQEISNKTRYSRDFDDDMMS